MSKRLLVLIGGLALVVALVFGAKAATFAQTAGPNAGRGNYGQGGMGFGNFLAQNQRNIVSGLTI